MAIEDLRQEYDQSTLDEADVAADPMAQFGAWFDAAQAAGILEPNAMTLSTVSADGTPAARVVLLKGFDQHGFTFFTNYDSDKGTDMQAHPAAALTFFWDKLQRQVRIVGSVSKASREASELYFHSRPRPSQLAAWISEQSRVISGRDVLEQRMAEISAHFAEKPVDLPPFWGGYCVAPAQIEFWQGRRSRLHDRLRYRRDAQGVWIIERLSP